MADVQRILVTGATGKVGQAFIARLFASGDERLARANRPPVPQKPGSSHTRLHKVWPPRVSYWNHSQALTNPPGPTGRAPAAFRQLARLEWPSPHTVGTRSRPNLPRRYPRAAWNRGELP